LEVTKESNYEETRNRTNRKIRLKAPIIRSPETRIIGKLEGKVPTLNIANVATKKSCVKSNLSQKAQILIKIYAPVKSKRLKSQNLAICR